MGARGQAFRGIAKRAIKRSLFWPLLALAGLFLLGQIAFVVPRRIYPSLNEDQLKQLDNLDDRLKAQNDRFKLQNDLRATLLQGIGGAVLIFGLFLTARQIRNTREQLETDRERQVTERFTRAIDQIGSKELDVRLGGIYALERIASDSPRDQSTIEEVLSAFVREHSPWPPLLREQSPADGNADKPKRWLAKRRKLSPDNGVAEAPGPRVMADVQASMTVLGRQLPPRDQRLDLRKVQIVDPTEALETVFQASLHRRLYLRSVGLRGYELSCAHLEMADLAAAHLEEADLAAAHLEGSILVFAHLERALLMAAHLEEANLEGAHLERAILMAAHLERANLLGANLNGTNLIFSKLKGARCDSKTVWPENFDWRAATGLNPSESPPSTT